MRGIVKVSPFWQVHHDIQDLNSLLIKLYKSKTPLAENMTICARHTTKQTFHIIGDTLAINTGRLIALAFISKSRFDTVA